MEYLAKGHLSGVSGSISTIGATGINTGIYGSVLIDTMNTRKNWDLDPLLDQQGELVGGTVRGKRLEMDITFVPVGGASTDSSAAVKSLISLIPTSVTYITITNCPDSAYNATFSILEPIGVSYTNTGKAAIGLSCVRYDSVTPETLATVKT